MSDLHLEYDARAFDQSESEEHRKHAFDFYLHPPQPQADLLILAGDIHTGAEGIDWAARSFPLPSAIICGNHEPYGHELFRVIAYNRQKSSATNGKINFLERAVWSHRTASGERFRIIGMTLWTDFALYGNAPASMAIAVEKLEDFQVIRLERGFKVRPLQPSDLARLHRISLEFLRKELQRPFDGATIVVTHHAPSPKSIAKKFLNDPLNPAFVSNLDYLILDYKPALWIHGHLHDSFDYVIGHTRVVCNPRGYFPDQLNPRFDPHLVVELA